MSPITEWEDPGTTTILLPGWVHVWAWRHGNSLPELDLSCLDENEIGRYRRFRFRSDQLRFAMAHCNMRRILAGYLGQTPDSLVFASVEGSKPALIGSQASDLKFNLSHTRSFGILAVAAGLEVGVDVEEPRKIQPSLAKRYFSAVELQMLSELSAEEWLWGFLRCWTRKEAILKAEGVGLRVPLNSFDVSLKSSAAPALLGFRPPAKFHVFWQLYDVSPTTGAIASLAVSCPPLGIKLFRYNAN